MQAVEVTRQLEEIYGSDPSLVGAEDGTEDDFGDLINDTVELLGYTCETLDAATWDHVQDVAASSQTTTMSGWVALLEAALCAVQS